MLLEIQNVVKEYKKGIRANDGISLSVGEGQVFGLLGPNGAGKTTLVNQIIGLLVPTYGAIKIDGVDVIAKPDYARQVCSFQSQTQVPIAGLTAKQAIELVGQIRGGNKTRVRGRTKELIDSLEIGQWANKMGATLSGGVRRIVAYCMAAVVPGRIVILDEPTNDIDPVRRRLLWNSINKLAQEGATVLLVTHNVLEAERAVNQLAIIDRGRVVSTGTPADIKGQDSEYMRFEVVMEPATTLPPSPYFLENPVVLNRRIVAKIKEANIPEALRWAQSLKAKGDIEEFLLGPTTLEDAYVRIVGRPDVLEKGEEGRENG